MWNIFSFWTYSLHVCQNTVQESLNAWRILSYFNFDSFLNLSNVVGPGSLNETRNNRNNETKLNKHTTLSFFNRFKSPAFLQASVREVSSSVPLPKGRHQNDMIRRQKTGKTWKNTEKYVKIVRIISKSFCRWLIPDWHVVRISIKMFCVYFVNSMQLWYVLIWCVSDNAYLFTLANSKFCN